MPIHNGMTLSQIYLDPPRSDLWGTPAGLREAAEKLLYVKFSDFDPSPFPRPVDFDGLKVQWGNKGDAIFCNPPFTKCKEFMEKAVVEACNGRTVAMLIAARSDTQTWHSYVFGRADAIYFIKGRLKFENLSAKAIQLGLNVEGAVSDYKPSTTGAAAFPSALIVYRPTGSKLTRALPWLI